MCLLFHIAYLLKGKQTNKQNKTKQFNKFCLTLAFSFFSAFLFTVLAQKKFFN